MHGSATRGESLKIVGRKQVGEVAQILDEIVLRISEGVIDGKSVPQRVGVDEACYGRQDEHVEFFWNMTVQRVTAHSNDYLVQTCTSNPAAQRACIGWS